MEEHRWTGGISIPRCRKCGCTSLEAQVKQPETKGTGPCPLEPDQKLAEKLIQEWADAVNRGEKWVPTII